MPAIPPAIDHFIAHWQGREGGQERANYALFLTGFCAALGLPQPEPASATTEDNDYVFERFVRNYDDDGNPATRRIDLYKKGCFVLEAKQSRQPGGRKASLALQSALPGSEAPRRGARTAARGWDVLMLNARRQAEGYARALPTDHGWPPFILVCDVGHVLEVFADFSGQGKNYAQFPDRQSFRIYLEDLRDPAILERLTRIWTDPHSLDPARESARVTREIAERLATVSRALEKSEHAAETVAMFLMRCLFTMFAEDIGLLPEKSFSDILARCEKDPSRFEPVVRLLWETMDTGGFSYTLETKIRQFNGAFFKDRTVLPLGREEIAELRRAAEHNWKDVAPSIFGTLLEQALSTRERKQFGAHYTPRAYVERLVVATVIEPLRDDWNKVLGSVERQKSEGRAQDAIAAVLAFHDSLCRTRILDPACGTGNFLYVSLELLKRLEGEVLEVLADLGGQEALTGLDRHTVDPHQFLGLEINPRAVGIAELVLWIGYLQWHSRTSTAMPREPILRAFRNIQQMDAVLEADINLARDASGAPITKVAAGGERVEVYHYGHPRQPAWPEAEFIIGNPPFIGNKRMREMLGTEYVDALWSIYRDMEESADFVMCWWERSALLLTKARTSLRRFGLVTTNSITQVFQRRIVANHIRAKQPVSLILAIPDHPWTKATRDTAAVRIAMTVVQAGHDVGRLETVIYEADLDTDQPRLDFKVEVGLLNADLTIGTDITSTVSLKSNQNMSFRGITYLGAGFILTEGDAKHLISRESRFGSVIRPYLSGRDLTSRPRGVQIIDLYGLTEDDVRTRYPAIYQHLLLKVKPVRSFDNRDSYRLLWWLFAEPRREFRDAATKLSRYIAISQTAKHLAFQFIDTSYLPDQTLVLIASEDGFDLGVLSSKLHKCWSLIAGGTLEDRPRYTNSRCFDPFPFPAADDLQKHRIRRIAEDLDAHRKRVLEDHPHLTLTGLYNVLEKLRAGTQPDALDTADRRIFDDGLVLILKEYHDRLDTEVAAAYGWPADLPDTEILARLVALNRERVREEAAGQIRWLRPDYQIPRFGTEKDKAGLRLQGGAMREAAPDTKPGAKPSFPIGDVAQTGAVMLALVSAGGSVSAAVLAARFRQGRRVLPQLQSILAALVRTGAIASPDGGQTFQLRRIA